MYNWLENHIAICSWIITIFTILSFVFKFILKKKKEHSQNISNVHDSTINQASGNITIESKDAK